MTMDNSPISNNPFDDDESYTRNVRLGILGFALLMCCAFSAFGLIVYQTNIISLYDRYFPTPTRTATPTATFTPTITSTPTATSTPTPNLTATRDFQSTNTALAFQATATNAVSEWQEIFSETFDENGHGWVEHTIDTEFVNLTYEIKDGKYQWDAMAHKGFIEWITLPTKSVDDMFLTVEVSLGDHTGPSDYGIIFRSDLGGNFYYFAVDSDNMYSLYKYYAGGWSTLIDRNSTSIIRKDEPNQLTVIAEGDHLMLFINDRFIADTHDDSIKQGTAALAIEIFQPDQQATFEFDNIELRIP